MAQQFKILKVNINPITVSQSFFKSRKKITVNNKFNNESYEILNELRIKCS